MNRTEQEGTEMHKRLKAVIGYWTDYYDGKISETAFFLVNGQRIKIFYKSKSETFIISYRWLMTEVYYEEIFDTLDLYEDMMKGMSSNVGKH